MLCICAQGLLIGKPLPQSYAPAPAPMAAAAALGSPGWAASFRYRHQYPNGGFRTEARLLLANIFQAGSYARKVSFWPGTADSNWSAWHGEWSVAEDESAINVKFHWNAAEEWAANHNFQRLHSATTGNPYFFAAKMERDEVHSIFMWDPTFICLTMPEALPAAPAEPPDAPVTKRARDV